MKSARPFVDDLFSAMALSAHPSEVDEAVAKVQARDAEVRAEGRARLEKAEELLRKRSTRGCANENYARGMGKDRCGKCWDCRARAFLAAQPVPGEPK